MSAAVSVRVAQTTAGGRAVSLRGGGKIPVWVGKVGIGGGGGGVGKEGREGVGKEGLWTEVGNMLGVSSGRDELDAGGCKTLLEAEELVAPMAVVELREPAELVAEVELEGLLLSGETADEDDRPLTCDEPVAGGCMPLLEAEEAPVARLEPREAPGEVAEVDCEGLMSLGELTAEDGRVVTWDELVWPCVDGVGEDV